MAVPIPPKDAEILTTACDYCAIACGYKGYRWPVGKAGGLRASENALGIDLGNDVRQDLWLSPSMHSVIELDSKKYNLLVVPDHLSNVVNREGNHSVRGRGLAQKFAPRMNKKKGRLTQPLLRVKGKFEPISWDLAIEIFAAVSGHVVDEFGPAAWAQKRFSYQFFENTYALSKIAWQSIQSPAYADHDNPGKFTSTPGLKDAGIDSFSACYEDYYLAETLFFSGSDPYETKTTLFTDWVMKGVRERGNRLIFVNPRKTSGVAFGERNGGLHLDIIPGTDAVLHMALARIILEEGWEDSDFLSNFVTVPLDHKFDRLQADNRKPWKWKNSFPDFKADGVDDYREWLFAQKESELSEASKITGLKAEKIRKAAEMLAKPKKDGSRVKSSFFFEKGLYWSNNYLGTASLASLALVCGAGNRPGQMLSRLGGHQRGNMTVSHFPRLIQPREFEGYHRKCIDLDRWLVGGNLRFAWVVGTNWISSMAGANSLERQMRHQTVEHPSQIKSVKTAIEDLKERTDKGGLVLVEQNLYLTEIIGEQLADLVLPAAGWGECDYTRANSERRIRFYSKLAEPPGEALPDWKIVSLIAKKMGFSGYDWKDSNDIFEEAALASRRSIFNFDSLVHDARLKNQKAHDVLKGFGTEGIQAPIQYLENKLVGTPRLHNPELQIYQKDKRSRSSRYPYTKAISGFLGKGGKANLVKSPWNYFSDFYQAIAPEEDELWVLNGRINELWQSGFDDLYQREEILKRYPVNFLEMHPEDAKKRGIRSGDLIRVTSEKVFTQKDGYAGYSVEENRFEELQKKGLIEKESDSLELVAIVNNDDSIRPGVTFLFYLYPNSFANRIVSRVPDPISGNYRFKLATGRVEKLGETPFQKEFERLSFASRIPEPE